MSSAAPVPRLRVAVARARSEEAGQSSVELVALLPLVVVVALVMLQGAIAAQAAWLSGSAAQAAARAQALGDEPLAAARRAVPGHLRRGVATDEEDGEVEVSIEIESVLGDVRLGRVSARARMEEQ